MKGLGFGRCALTGCVATVMLVGCGVLPLSLSKGQDDMPPPMGALGVMPQSLAKSTHENASYLYVGTDEIPGGQRVLIFLRDDLSKGVVDSIRDGVSEPAGLFVDSAGTLYVADDDSSLNDRVTVYAKGGHKPIRVIRGGIECAADVVAGSDGIIYVADPCGTNGQGRVHVFGPASSKQVRLLYPGGAPNSVTLDAQNRLYVGYTVWPHFEGQVKRYRPGTTEGEKLLPKKTVFAIGGIQVDKQGALLVASTLNGTIDVFTGIRKPPSRIIKTGQSYPSRFVLDRRENRIYVSSPFVGSFRADSGSGGKRPNTVVELDYPSGKRLFTLRDSGWFPTGVAVSPSAPF